MTKNEFKAEHEELRGTKTLLHFHKDGVTGNFDVVDGKFDYVGDIPISDAARMLFEILAEKCGEWWMERAASHVGGQA
jgi:hypothetical protein